MRQTQGNGPLCGEISCIGWCHKKPSPGIQRSCKQTSNHLIEEKVGNSPFVYGRRLHNELFGFLCSSSGQQPPCWLWNKPDEQGSRHISAFLNGTPRESLTASCVPYVDNNHWKYGRCDQLRESPVSADVHHTSKGTLPERTKELGHTCPPWPFRGTNPLCGCKTETTLNDIKTDTCKGVLVMTFVYNSIVGVNDGRWDILYSVVDVQYLLLCTQTTEMTTTM